MKHALLLSFASLFATSIAAAAVNCAQIPNTSGLWKAQGTDRAAYQISQSGCRVSVTELLGESTGAVWQFDLSDDGTRQERIPQRIIALNGRSGAGTAGVTTLESFRYSVGTVTTSQTGQHHQQMTVPVHASMRVEPQGPLSFPVTTRFSGRLQVYSGAVVNGVSRADYISLRIDSMQIVDVEQLHFGSPFEKRAFISGANFVLRMISAEHLLDRGAGGPLVLVPVGR